MTKVQLGTRIPESLNLEIENMAKYKDMKKQELVEQLLRHGLAIVSNQKNLTEPNKTSQTEFDDNGLSLIKSNSVIVSESTSPSKEAIAVKKIEKSLANLKKEVEALSLQVVELKETVELAFVSNQASNSSSFTIGKKQNTKILDFTSSQETVVDSVEDPLSLLRPPTRRRRHRSSDC
ncbi:hypothetical protein JOY44_27175 (plasmid) [Phormidium sp. CLA17]|uniref:hypothetical protein n=1 Tax=Leptolyngbya sp. Cla-17 TaxID=2803751 RepID=UPI001492DEEA|nr:hypothetical protein [Leptolyngbya sp. Cla-17]MBM0745162.1 hypothetical protein [Leptolyngbya sp. Cla-17]